MAEKYTPETPMVKEIWVEGFAGYHVEPGSLDYAEGLAQFNRWYTRELEEAREEGRQAGIKEERERFATAPRETGHALFVGPYELHHDYVVAKTRLEELANEGRYGTILNVTLARHTGDALGLTVTEPMLDVARQSEEGI